MGLALDHTGVGAPVGVAVHGVATGVIAHGATVAGNEAAHAMSAIKRRSGSRKARPSNVPSWAEGQAPRPGENGRQFATRLMDAKYGPGK